MLLMNCAMVFLFFGHRSGLHQFKPLACSVKTKWLHKFQIQVVTRLQVRIGCHQSCDAALAQFHVQTVLVTQMFDPIDD